MEFHGGRDLERALGDLKLGTRRGVARRVMKKALVPFVELARQLAPKRSGALALSYVITSRLNKASARERGRVPKDWVLMHAGTASPAGATQEFGTEVHGPQPHARPAWDQTKTQVLRLVQQGMAVEVEKSLARAARKAAANAAKQ